MIYLNIKHGSILNLFFQLEIRFQNVLHVFAMVFHFPISELLLLLLLLFVFTKQCIKVHAWLITPKNKNKNSAWYFGCLTIHRTTLTKEAAGKSRKYILLC